VHRRSARFGSLFQSSYRICNPALYRAF